MPPPPLRSAITRRRFGAGTLAALPVAIPRPARSLTIAGVGGWFATAFDGTILAAFRKTHPDITVFYYPLGNSFQVLGMLHAQRSRPATDVVLLEAGFGNQATADGLLEGLAAETTPVLRDLIPAAIVADVAGPALLLDSLAICYSPAQVKRPPRSWRNLWDPAYGSRIAMQTPPDPAALAMAVVAGSVFGGGDLYRSLDVGLTALTQLTARVVLWDPVPDIYTAIAVGDANIGPGWNARAQNQASLTPGRFAAVIPEDGSPVRATTISLVRGCPEPDAARVLISWLLGPEAQRLLAETMFFAPVNAKTELAAASLARAGASAEIVARRIGVDWVAVNAIRDQITREWRRRNLSGR